MSSINKHVHQVLALILLSALFTGCGSMPQSSAPAQPASETSAAQSAETVSGWQPTKAVTIVVQSGAGGGSDIYCRKFAEIVNAKGLSPYPVVVENRAGGGGAVCYNYVGIQRKGDPHFLTTAVSTLLTTPLQGMAEVSYEDFTPIARIGVDASNVLLVPANSQFKTAQEFIDYAKANPELVNFGGANIGSADSVMTYLLETGTGINLNYVTFSGGGEVITAALGGHVNAIWGNVAETLEYVNSGDVRVLATISAQRLEALPDIPTFAEIGYPEVVYDMFRGFVAPGDISPEAIAYWEEVARQVYESPEWQEDYLKVNMILPGFMGSVDFGQELKEQNDFYAQVLHELGLI